MIRIAMISGATLLVLGWPFPILAQQSPAPPPSAPVAAQPFAGPGVTITPLSNQSMDQAKLDDAQCQNAATGATGYIPGAAAPTTAGAPQVGGRAAGAAKGAAIGAVAGEVQGNQYDRVPDSVQDEYRGNQAAAGATAGVVAGGMNQRQGRRQTRADQAKAEQAAAQKETAWHNSYAGCIQARGYAIR